MRRLRACLAHTRPGGWGHRPGQLCGSAVRRLDAERTKAAKAVRIRGRVTSPVRTRKYGPLAQSPAMERRKAMRFRTSHRFARDAGSETKTRCASRRSMPLVLCGASFTDQLAINRESNHAWLFRSGCLKIESECDVTYASATPTIVITGLDPVIHALLANLEIVVDGRVKPGHDELRMVRDVR